MDSNVARYVIVGAFGMHGVGMLGAAGYLPFDSQRSFIGPSWLVGSGALDSILGVLIWGIAGAGYVAAAWGFWRGAEWWTVAAWIGAVFTLAAIAVWVGKVPFGVYVGGLLAIATIGFLAFG